MNHKITKFMVLANVCGLGLLATNPVLAKNQSVASSEDIYRLYNSNTGEHLYTSKPNEKTELIKVGWLYEGIGWVGPVEGEPVYRLYNPNADGGDHYYTTNQNEADSLVSLGWMMDYGGEPVFYSGGDVNLYSAYNPNAKSGSHNYTTSRTEQDSLITLGWLYDQVAWKVLDQGHEDTDPTLFERLAGQEFVRNIWGFAGGASAFLTVNADGTYRETNVRLSSHQGIGSEYSEFVGQFSDPVKVDDYTWKAQVISSDLVAPVNTVIEDGKSSKIMLEPFAGLYAPMDFYIASPDKPIEDYPTFVQEQYAKFPDSYKANFPGSYVLYTPDGMTFMFVKNQ